VAAQKLELHGFTNVVIFAGGLGEWEKAGYPFATILLHPVDTAPEQAVPAPQSLPTEPEAVLEPAPV